MRILLKMKKATEEAGGVDKVLNFRFNILWPVMLVLLFGYCELRAQDGQHLYDSVLTVISDKTIGFTNKDQTVTSTLDYFTLGQRIELLQKMLAYSKLSDEHLSRTITYYNNILLYYSFLDDFDHARTYLDTVLRYESRADDADLAKMYYTIGTFYSAQANMPQAHDYYYKSIDYYEKTGNQQMQIDILYSLAVAYIPRKDTLNLKKIIDRMSPLVQQAGDAVSLVYFYTIKGSYFETLFDNNKELTQYKDSLLSCDEHIIRIYEAIDNPPPTYGYQIALNYLRWANMAMDVPAIDTDLIKQRIEKAEQIANPEHLSFRIGYHQNLGLYHLRKRNTNAAVKEAEEVLRLLPQFDKSEYGLYVHIYETLSKIYEADGNLTRALGYERLKTEYQAKLYDQESYQTIQELETRYEVAKKEEDIQRLTERNRYQERIRYLTLGILGLTLLAAILGFLWFRRKRRSDTDALKIAKLQQQEAELKAEMEAAKLEEKEQEFDALASDMEVRQIKSYIDGLEAERTRLAGELHDNVSNALLGVEFKMRTPGASQEEVSGMLHGIHEHVRNISHALMPPVFQHATLAEIITDYVYMQNGMNGPRFECHIEPEDDWEDLPQETALELHRIVQEACGNALKHSEASLISITLQRDGDRVTLAVKDNGRGMDVNSKKTGLGLQIIRDRSAKMNGSAEIISALGKGTTVMITV